MIGEKKIHKDKNILGPIKEKVYIVFWEKRVEETIYKLCRGQDNMFAMWVEYPEGQIAYKPYKTITSQAYAIKWAHESFQV